MQQLIDFVGIDNFEFYPNFISEENSVRLFTYCRKTVPWMQHSIRFYDKIVPVPRLTKWYGDMEYKYSGITNPPCKMDIGIYKVMEKINTQCNTNLNSCLLNYYRNGKYSISLHKDDERELGSTPLIAVVSLGETREFIIQRASDKSKLKVPLPTGSLFIMKNNFNSLYAHGIDKVKDVVSTGGRISLTYRYTL